MQDLRLNLYVAMWPFMVCVSLILLLSLRPGKHSYSIFIYDIYVLYR